MARQVLDNGVILPSEYSDDWYDDMTSNLTKLDEVIGSDEEKLSASDVGEAAISNDYDDLDDKPAYNILRRASVTLTAGGTGNYTDLDSDSKIKAGDYVLDAANKLYSITAIDAANSTYTVSAAALFTVTDKAELGAAALSNSYDDLSNLPGYGVLRFCSTAITDNSSVAFANISSVSKIAAGDFLLDTAGKMYVIASVDTANETVFVTTQLTQLAVDSNVVHKSGNEYITDTKTFGKGTLIVDNSVGSNVHGEIKLNGSRSGYIVADNASDGVFDSAGCGVSILLQDSGKPLHVGGYKVDSNGRVFADNTNKKPVLSIISSLIKTATLVPENDTVNAVFGILSQLDYANGNPSKTLDVRFIQYDNANATSAIYSNDDNKTLLGVSSKKWRDVLTYKVNGVEPSSLGMPNINNSIDISGSFTNTGTGEYNTYTATSNGWIFLQLGTISSCQAQVLDSSDNILWGTSSSGSVEMLIIPMLSGCKLQTQWATGSAVNVATARFYPCQGNV